VLIDSGFNPIVDIEIKNPFNYQEYLSDKFSILDLKATDENGRIYNIEVQTTGNSAYVNRTLYYWAKLYSSQISESEIYSVIKPVICINLLNFVIVEETDKYHTCYVIREKDSNDLILTDHLSIHFLELPKIEKLLRNTTLEKWLLYFKYEGSGEETLKTILKDEPVLQNMHSNYKKFTMDDKLRDAYESRKKAEMDQRSMLVSARQEGMHDKTIETATKMLYKGMNFVDISEITGLTPDEIKKLKK